LTRSGDDYWELLAKSAPDFLCLVDTEGHYVWVNRLHPDLTLDDVIGNSIENFASPETVAEFRRCVARVLETRDQHTYHSVSHVGEDEMVHRVTVVPVPGRDDIVVLATRNVTEQRKAEAALSVSESLSRSVMQMYPDLLMLIEPDGTLITANRGLADSLGVDSAELAGKNVFDLMEPEVAERRRGYARKVLDTREAQREVDRHRGRVFDSVGYPITAEDGSIIGIAMMSRDITEAIQKEQLLRERQARQWHSEKMEALGTLAAGIAHDFNNLLTSMMANAELANRPAVSAAQRTQLLGAITKTGQRAAELVKQILAHASEDAEETDVDLCLVIAEVVSLMRATLSAATEFDAALPAKPVWVRGNAARLHQAVMNLCINAGQAMPEGGRVAIGVDRIDVGDERPGVEPGRYVRVRVTDTGHGIPRKVLPRIFEPFYSTKGPDRGSGLGLYVVHGVVTGARGTIDVESELGRGTTFTLLLPASGRESSESAATPAVSPRAAPPSRRVLLLEDEEAIRQVAVFALESEGHEVCAVASCSDALELVAPGADTIDIALLDQRVGDGSGLSVATALRERYPQLPIVLCSGHVTKDMRAQCCELAVEVMAKPYHLDQLLDCVASLGAGLVALQQ